MRFVEQVAQCGVRLGSGTVAPNRVEEVVLTGVLALRGRRARLRSATVVGFQVDSQAVLLHVQTDTSLETVVVAVLHDIIEDTEVDEEYLLNRGISGHLVEVISLLTRCEGETYEEYIEHIASNKIAIEVKLEDLKHNMDLTRLNREITDKDLERNKKYMKAYFYLLSEYVKYW